MAFILFDDWLYMDDQGQTGSYGRDEFDRNFASKIKKVSVVFINCETKCIMVPGEDMAQKEAFVNSAFTQEHLIQEERLLGNEYQLIAAQKSLIEEIYKYFKKIQIETVIPYPVSIRAYLKSKNLVHNHQVIIFVDDLKTQAILTIFDGMRFSSPRRISIRDLIYMAGEIKRSFVNFSCVNAQDKPKEVILISNNKQWLEAFVDSKLVGQDKVIHIDCMYPVLEGLKLARFATRFILPQELARMKRTQIMRKRVKEGVYLLGVVLISILLHAFARMYAEDLKLKESQEYFNQNMAIKDLIKMNQDKFQSINPKDNTLPLSRIYFDFRSGLPSNYVVKDFSIEKDDAQWRFKGRIYPANESVGQENYLCTGNLKECTVTAISNQNQLGSEIQTRINLKQEQS